jgi:uncharacterized protein YqjF (DUF2071 family)
MRNLNLPTLDDRFAMRGRPDRCVVGRQRWSDLLFLHWQIDPALVQSTLPDGLTVDTHNGAAYVGIVPFFMERIRPRWLPALPWVSWFLELNVRTYVHDRNGRPGVWFYSLDCNQPIAVVIARRLFHLQYHHAQMRARRSGGSIDYICRRRGTTKAAPFSWQAEGTAMEAAPGSLQFFLVERYALFSTAPDGTLHMGRVHHRPYLLRGAAVKEFSTEPARHAGFELAGPPTSALCSDAVDVEIFALERM